MADETPRRRTNLHDSHRRQWEEGREPSHMSFTGFQIGICVFCIVAAVVVRVVGGSTYSTVKTAVSRALAGRDAGSQLSEVFRTVKGYFPDVQEVFQSAPSNSASSGGTSSAVSGVSGASSAVSAGQTASSGGSAVSQAGSQTASGGSSSVASHTAAAGVTDVRPAGGAV